MEQCGYCDKPLAEMDKVRWYSECVHAACYEELLADGIAMIAIEQLVEQHNEEAQEKLA